MESTTSPVRQRSQTVKLLLAPVVVVVLAGGFYVISRIVPTGGLVAIGAGVSWIALAGGAFLFLVRRDRFARLVVVGAALVVAVVGGYLIRPQGNEVDEEIVTAAPATEPTPSVGPTREPPARRNVQVSSGTFEGVSGHSGTGTAAVIKLAQGGRRLTFSDFDVDPGAGRLRVYLAAGNPGSDSEVDDFIDLAPLKGTKGNQQYELPRNVDLRRYGTVIVWCVPFTTRIAQAPLR